MEQSRSGRASAVDVLRGDRRQTTPWTDPTALEASPSLPSPARRFEWRGAPRNPRLMEEV
eukprot:7750855-Pyramimonas_sp.AAC.1